MQDAETGRCRSLWEIETEVDVEKREWGRHCLREKLQIKVDQHGWIFPPQRPGQFWTAKGLRHLQALEEARANGHGDQVWPVA